MMAYRSYRRTIPGKPYAVVWPEWHIRCAEPQCDESVLIALGGDCFSAKDAEKMIRKKETEESMRDWTEKDGLWYCPKHSEGYREDEQDND